MIILAALDIKLPDAVFYADPSGEARRTPYRHAGMIGMMFESAGDKALYANGA